ncbi:unnamed protein product, partial [Tetraodon nigroviridis]
SRFTVLFSHGNAVDLGQMSSFYVGLGTRINCNIFSYDYSGYGVTLASLLRRTFTLISMQPGTPCAPGKQKETSRTDASRRCPKSHLQCSSFTVQRTRSSTSRTAWPCSSVAPKPWSPCGLEGAGHNDIELYSQYLERLRRFINQDLAAQHA